MTIANRFRFRAWNPLLKEMFGPFHLIEVPKFLDNLTGTHYELEFGMPSVELMQSTGLVDKNGREIFEGDIILRACPDDCPTTQGDWSKGCIVKWVNSGFITVPIAVGVTGWPFGYNEELEIIGNIHQAAWTIIPKGKPRPSGYLGILPADLKSRGILKQEQTENE